MTECKSNVKKKKGFIDYKPSSCGHFSSGAKGNNRKRMEDTKDVAVLYILLRLAQGKSEQNRSKLAALCWGF